ncbi:MAG: trypsin-like peptidase domain-containing protein [Pseudomonadota bacterium]
MGHAILTASLTRAERVIRPVIATALLAAFLAVAPAPAAASPAEALPSVVSVLPVWPQRPQGGAGAPQGSAPEGSGVVIRPGGVIATAWHVIEPAERIDVRLADGRIVPARLIAQDPASDIALLRIEDAPPAIAIAPTPGLADPACAIGNAYGLGLSVTCGVVSALGITEAGFNALEDFVQTDAAANPGVSGGALVDGEGRLIGMMSAIFASGGDTDIGINFAVSAPLLSRVTDALLAEGTVDYVSAGWRLARPGRAQMRRRPGAAVARLQPDGPAAAAGIEVADIIVSIAGRRILKPRDAIAALALLPPGTKGVEVVYLRAGAERRAALSFADPIAPVEETSPPQAEGSDADCPHPAEVCAVRQAVFPISSFDPVGSATRIGASLLVTNRHVVADRAEATVFTPSGPLAARVVASAYPGDLALLEVEGLPPDGLVLQIDVAERGTAPFYAIGADVARQEIRVFERGALLARPAADAPLGRLHVSARMQPGVSGGALVDAEGDLVAIAVGGGEGRFEAVPIGDVSALLALREAADADTVHRALGTAFAACAEALEAAGRGRAEQAALDQIEATCTTADNQGQLLDAGRVMGRSGAFAKAIDLHAQAVAQTPNSVNARLSLLVSLQLAGRFADMVPHARWVMEAADGDAGALRFAIQSGVWGGDPDLAEAGYRALLEADPRQAQAARRFIDNAPPAPPQR